MIAKCFASKNPGSSSVLRLVNYITHDQGKVSRVGDVSVVNCHNDDPYMAALEIQNRQDMNTRAKGDKTFHLMLSFRPGETPMAETMKRIEQAVCAGLGYAEHQRVSVVHSDTDSTHIHLAINKIHPEKNTMHNPRFPYKILAAMCKDLEREFSLRQDNHEPEKTVGEGKAQDVERMSGTESLVSWIRRECLDGVKQAGSWQKCHDVLRKHGLVLKPQGAGMVFVSTEGVSVKASTVDRGFSKKHLEDRFGKFVPGAVPEKTPELEYKKGIPVKSAVADLWDEFKKRQETIKTERDAEIARIKERRDRELEKASLEYKARVALARTTTGRGARSAEFAGASKIYKAQATVIRRNAKEGLQAAYKGMPRQNWLTWLQDQAKNDRPEAVQALRARAYAEAMKITNAIQGEVDNAAGVVLPNQKIDSVTKNGNVIYSVGKDAIKDTGKQLALSREASQDTMIMALRMAQQRFKGPLFVSGSPEYRERVLNAAVAANLRVRFENSDMEAKRRQLIHAKQNTLTNSRAKKGKEME